MHVYDDDDDVVVDKPPLCLAQYIRANPSSALSARWVFNLPEEEQGDCMKMMIEHAVYPETWMSYLTYAELKGIVITDDIALEAIHDVGIDPHSASLWLKIIHLSVEEERKRELFQLALQMPLYQQDILYGAYKAFETEASRLGGRTITNCLQPSDIAQYTEFLRTEPMWPDRFVDVKMCGKSRRDMICSQWNHLLRSLLDRCAEDRGECDLNLRRAELAFRQLCSQFAHEDLCWYAYACFVATEMNDISQAQELIERGCAATGGESIGLRSLGAALSITDTMSIEFPHDKSRWRIFEQRICANTAKDSLQHRKRFRDTGKSAVAENLSDWRIYHQWASAECFITHDFSMAAKVYERGVACAAKSLKDAILLSNEAATFHIWREDEREALGYAERQIELLSSSEHDGLRRASWNHLVNVEMVLGLPSLRKALRRRTERYTEFPQNSIIERYRVGGYIPCTDEDLDWIEYVDDLSKARKEELEPVFETVTPMKHLALSVGTCCQSSASVPDENLWSAFLMCPNREHSSSAQDADEVVGPRTLRGRLVYKLKIDDKTESRLKREEQMRGAKIGDGDGVRTLGSSQSALQALVKKLEAREWNATQLRMCRCLNAEWLMNILTVDELDLAKRRS